jgi:hypothetical protein
MTSPLDGFQRAGGYARAALHDPRKPGLAAHAARMQRIGNRVDPTGELRTSNPADFDVRCRRLLRSEMSVLGVRSGIKRRKQQAAQTAREGSTRDR